MEHELYTNEKLNLFLTKLDEADSTLNLKVTQTWNDRFEETGMAIKTTYSTCEFFALVIRTLAQFNDPEMTEIVQERFKFAAHDFIGWEHVFSFAGVKFESMP